MQVLQRLQQRVQEWVHQPLPHPLVVETFEVRHGQLQLVQVQELVLHHQDVQPHGLVV